MYDNTTKKANAFLNAGPDADILKLYKHYSASLKQLTQVLKALENKDEVKQQVEILLEIHEKVEEKLVSEKDSAYEKIRTTLCREQLRHKYHSGNIKSSLVNRKF